MLGARRGRTYDRARLLEKAARARKRGRPAKAIACYREVLAVEPDNTDVLRRMARLLARARQAPEAWATYQRAAENLAKQGFRERAIGLYREAAASLPRESDLWIALAGLEVERDRPVDAAKALREGRRHFRGRRRRNDAMRLLREAHRLEPTDLLTACDLASVRARCGQRRAALELLEQQLRHHPHRRLRIRTRQLLVAPRPRIALDWLAALLRLR